MNAYQGEDRDDDVEVEVPCALPVSVMNKGVDCFPDVGRPAAQKADDDQSGCNTRISHTLWSTCRFDI